MLPVLAMPTAAQTVQASGETIKPAPATIEAGDAPTEATAPPRPLGELVNLQVISDGATSASSPKPRAISLDRSGSAGGHL